MPFTFADLCVRSDADYEALHRHTDHYAESGHSYEIRCALPPACVPDEAALGFCRIGRQYILYTRPQVSYCGTLPTLADFFAPGMRSFPDFSALIARLRLIGLELCGPSFVPSSSLFHRLRTSLGQYVLGQEAAVEAAAFRLYTHLSKKRPMRPLSLVLYGPTGTGKSEMGKSIVPILRELYPRQNWQSVWTDLNSFTEPHSVSRLVGSPPGYVGYTDRPVFETVQQTPYIVFMFDELDKAHPEVLKVFMSILDEGRCSARQEGSNGARELDFRQCIFIFTTNFDLTGTKKLSPGFAPSGEMPPINPSEAPLPLRLSAQDDIARRAMVRSGVLQEIAGRFTGLIGFTPLKETDRFAITVRQITSLGKEYGLQIASVSPDIAAALTPKDSFSVRSSAAVLEGVLTPLFAYHADNASRPLHLAGTPEQPILIAENA